MALYLPFADEDKTQDQEEDFGPVLVSAPDYYSALSLAGDEVRGFARMRGMAEPPIHGIKRMELIALGIWAADVWTSPEMAEVLHQIADDIAEQD